MTTEPADLTTLHVRRAVAGDSDSRSFLIEKFTPLLLVQARYRLIGAAARHCEPEGVIEGAPGRSSTRSGYRVLLGCHDPGLCARLVV